MKNKYIISVALFERGGVGERTFCAKKDNQRRERSERSLLSSQKVLSPTTVEVVCI